MSELKHFMKAFDIVYKKHKIEEKETLIWARLRNNNDELSLKLVAIKSKHPLTSQTMLNGFVIDGEKHDWRQLIVIYSNYLPSGVSENTYLLDDYLIIEINKRAKKLYNAAYKLKSAKKLYAEFYGELITNNLEFLGL